MNNTNVKILKKKTTNKQMKYKKSEIYQPECPYYSKKNIRHTLAEPLWPHRTNTFNHSKNAAVIVALPNTFYITFSLQDRHKIRVSFILPWEDIYKEAKNSTQLNNKCTVSPNPIFRVSVQNQ